MVKTNPTTSQAVDDSTNTSNATAQRTCTRCIHTYPTPQVYAFGRCGHMYCQKCLLYRFQTALRNQSDFPVRCCDTTVEIEQTSKYLPEKTAKQYKAKVFEYRAEHRTYCHIKKCSAFIPSYSVFEKRAICPACMESTCTDCKWEWHEGDCMAENMRDDPEMVQLARLNGWRKCPHCGNLVEKDSGCNHMVQVSFNCRIP